MNVHTDKLRQWSKAYQRYLNELDEKGVAKRGKAYRVGKFAKAINVKWPFRSSEEAVLFEGRAIETFEDTVRLLYNPGDFKLMLRKSGVSRRMIYYHLNRIYER